MTELNIQLSDSTIAKLAVEATKQNITLNDYIELIANQHVDCIVAARETEKIYNKPVAVEIVEDDIDDKKQQAKASSRKKKESHLKETDEEGSAPLYNKRHKNVWKIW